jgi:Rrf2 family protein
MLKFNRTTEYSLIAIRHMSRKRLSHPGEVTSAREIADVYHLPFEITAKTLQRLKENGFIQSEQGARGGYSLKKPLREVTLAEFLEKMEGPTAVVSCAPLETNFSKEVPCEFFTNCEIKGLMSNLNSRMVSFLSSICLEEIIEASGERIQLSKPVSPKKSKTLSTTTESRT